MQGCTLWYRGDCPLSRRTALPRKWGNAYTGALVAAIASSTWTQHQPTRLADLAWRDAEGSGAPWSSMDVGVPVDGVVLS